jgi:putative hydrolase of the HAD superfamily
MIRRRWAIGGAKAMAAQVVVFDLGGVLLPFDQALREQALGRALGLNADAARALVRSGIAEQLDLGLAGLAELAEAMSRAGGCAVSEAEACELWLSVFEAPNMPLWDAVARLRGRIRTAALSDNPHCVAGVFPRDDAFDAVFLSAELGRMKPARDVFAEVTGRLALAPHEIVFVDDSPRNIAAAAAFGWDAVAFASNAQLFTDLMARGLPIQG